MAQMQKTTSADGVIIESNAVSAGAGIAIAGAWLASAAVSIIIMLILFVWGNFTLADSKIDLWGMIVLGLIIAAPMIAAYSVTKLILNRGD